MILSEDEFETPTKISNDWYRRAHDFNCTTRVLFATTQNSFDLQRLKLPPNIDVRNSLGAPTLLNAGYALELLIKACIIRSRSYYRKLESSHELESLAKSGGIPFSHAQVCTLNIFSDAIKWWGRYPRPKKVDSLKNTTEHWNGSRKEEQFGKITLTESDEQRWPDFNNYSKIWEIANDHYWTILPRDPREYENLHQFLSENRFWTTEEMSHSALSQGPQ